VLEVAALIAVALLPRMTSSAHYKLQHLVFVLVVNKDHQKDDNMCLYDITAGVCHKWVPKPQSHNLIPQGGAAHFFQKPSSSSLAS
jgi:hypothetical protein